MIAFNDLLEREGFSPARTLLVRHKPGEAVLARVLRGDLAAGEAPLFDGYQASQGIHFGGWLRDISTLASFFEDGRGRAIFIGLYEVLGVAAIAAEAWTADPVNRRLIEVGMKPWAARDRDEALRLDLAPVEPLADLRGRLLVEWITRGQSWTHRADRHDLRVLAIHEESDFDPPPPNWEDWVLAWAELATLPPRRRARLAEWHGIYLIFDEKDGQRYVGSASGEQNLLGRWLGYADRGDGGNVLLRKRDPGSFRFSIVERVSPDMPPEDVVRIEARRKRRLRTDSPYGLNAN